MTVFGGDRVILELDKPEIGQITDTVLHVYTFLSTSHLVLFGKLTLLEPNIMYSNETASD